MSGDPARIRGIITDLDGTVYLSGRALPGVVDALARLRAAGIRVLFASNNPLRGASSYAERLSGLGIPADPRDVLTSGEVTAAWLAEHHPGGRVLALGEEALGAELTEAGLRLVDRAGDAEIVLASFDRTFTYAKWEQAFQAIRAGARFLATNPDVTCPVDGGEVPDCGGIIAALEATTGRRVEQVMGKPSPVMLRAALSRLDVAPAEALVVGDRLATDVAMGVDGGVASALVLSGVTPRSDRYDPAPTYALDGFADLPALLGLG